MNIIGIQIEKNLNNSATNKSHFLSSLKSVWNTITSPRMATLGLTSSRWKSEFHSLRCLLILGKGMGIPLPLKPEQSWQCPCPLHPHLCFLSWQFCPNSVWWKMSASWCLGRVSDFLGLTIFNMTVWRPLLAYHPVLSGRGNQVLLIVQRFWGSIRCLTFRTDSGLSWRSLY